MDNLKDLKLGQTIILAYVSKKNRPEKVKNPNPNANKKEISYESAYQWIRNNKGWGAAEKWERQFLPKKEKPAPKEITPKAKEHGERLANTLIKDMEADYINKDGWTKDGKTDWEGMMNEHMDYHGLPTANKAMSQDLKDARKYAVKLLKEKHSKA